MQAHACSLKGLKSSNASVRRPGMETTAEVIKKTLVKLGWGWVGWSFKVDGRLKVPSVISS